jgi:hypothetical protein
MIGGIVGTKVGQRGLVGEFDLCGFVIRQPASLEIEEGVLDSCVMGGIVQRGGIGVGGRSYRRKKES